MPCEMDQILDLAKAHDISVIEDCAQAHGAKFKGNSVGSLGDIGSWSFCQDKIMTTGGEGGMVTTNNHEYWSRLWSIKDHGKSWDAVYKRAHSTGFRWVHESFGSNWRMMELQAVIGRIQLKRMPSWHALRKKNARFLYSILLSCAGLKIPFPPDHVEHAWYKFYTFIRPEALKTMWTRDRIQQEIKKSGVPCFVGSCPEVYLEKAFENTKWRPKKRLSVAKYLGETSLMFMVQQNITKSVLEKTIHIVKSVMRKSLR